MIQRQEDEPDVPEPRGERLETLTDEFDTRLDWFEASRPFTTRGAESMLYFDDNMFYSIGNAWTNNYRLFSNFGLGDSLSADAANFFTPFAIDAALKHDFPLASEMFEREADISSIVISPTLFSFDIHDIPGTLRLPFLNIFGVDQPNPYAPVQRKCEECEEDERLSLQRSGQGADAASSFEGSLKQAQGGGKPLPSETLHRMENKIGADFSSVRVHTDETAVQLSRGIQAQAFTHGSDIYFNAGKFDVQSDAGTRLLAHELTHVVQQQSAPKK